LDLCIEEMKRDIDRMLSNILEVARRMEDELD